MGGTILAQNDARERSLFLFRVSSPITMNIEGVELPVIFRYQAFCCFQQRPPQHPKGSCSAAGAQPLWERLSTVLQSRNLSRVAMAGTGCLGFCNAGPLMVVCSERCL